MDGLESLDSNRYYTLDSVSEMNYRITFYSNTRLAISSSLSYISRRTDDNDVAYGMKYILTNDLYMNSINRTRASLETYDPDVWDTLDYKGLSGTIMVNLGKLFREPLRGRYSIKYNLYTDYLRFMAARDYEEN